MSFSLQYWACLFWCGFFLPETVPYYWRSLEDLVCQQHLRAPVPRVTTMGQPPRGSVGVAVLGGWQDPTFSSPLKVTLGSSVGSTLSTAEAMGWGTPADEVFWAQAWAMWGSGAWLHAANILELNPAPWQGVCCFHALELEFGSGTWTHVSSEDNSAAASAVLCFELQSSLEGDLCLLYRVRVDFVSPRKPTTDDTTGDMKSPLLAGASILHRSATHLTKKAVSGHLTLRLPSMQMKPTGCFLHLVSLLAYVQFCFPGFCFPRLCPHPHSPPALPTSSITSLWPPGHQRAAPLITGTFRKITGVTLGIFGCSIAQALGAIPEWLLIKGASFGRIYYIYCFLQPQPGIPSGELWVILKAALGS